MWKRVLGAIFFELVRNISFDSLAYKKVRRVFDKCRVKALRMCGSSIGTGVLISSNFYCNDPRKLTIIGPGTIGTNCKFYCDDRIIIGKNCLIGPNVTILTAEHGLSADDDYINQQSTSKRTIIGNNVYLGANVTILKGVTICDDCIVGAGVVVTQTLSEKGPWVGVKCKPIKK